MEKIKGVIDLNTKVSKPNSESRYDFLQKKSTNPIREAKTQRFDFPIPVTDKEKHVNHEKIAVGAYFIWQHAGSPHFGNDFGDWLKAEAAISKDLKATKMP